MAVVSGDRKIAGVESETTYGVDTISPGPPAAYQAFRAISIVPQVSMIEAPRATYSASGEKHCTLKSHNTVSWEMPFGGKTGAAGTAPAYDAFMLAAGFKKTVVADTSVTYKPNTQNDMNDCPSATIWMYRMMLDTNAAYLFKARGYRGNINVTLAIGDEAIIAGDGMALYDAYPTSTVTKPTAPTSYQGAGCMVVNSLVLTVGAVTYPVEGFNFSSNWAMSEVRTGESGGGSLSGVYLTRPSSGGRMTGSLTLVDGTTALQDAIGKWASGAQATLSATLTNGTDTITITAPNIQFGQVAETEEGVMKFDFPIYFNRGTSGDDEIVLTFT